MKRIGFQREDRGMIPIDETIESVCVDVADGVNTFTAYLVLAIVSCNGDFPDIAFVVCPVFEDMFVIVVPVFFLTSSMRTPKPIIKQWCDPLMTFHKHCSCYSLLTLR